MGYSVEDYIVFIETGRRDKISPDSLDEIAAAYRKQERTIKELIIINKTFDEKRIVYVQGSCSVKSLLNERLKKLKEKLNIK